MAEAKYGTKTKTKSKSNRRQNEKRTEYKKTEVKLNTSIPENRIK